MYDFYGDLNDVSINLQNFMQDLIKDAHKDATYYIGFPIFYDKDKMLKINSLIVSSNGIFACIEKESDIETYKQLIFNKLTCINFIKDKIFEGIDTFLHFIKITDKFDIDTYNRVFTDEQLQVINATLQNAKSINKDDNRMIKDENSLGNIIKKRNKCINTFDKDEFTGIYKNDFNNNIRIRGIAGSGKTVVLVKKMAYQYFRDPTKKMAYVFYTVSLKQYIKELFENFYHELNPDGEIDYENICFFHCWGTENYPGFYSTMCEKTNNDIEYFDSFKFYGENKSINDVCANLLKKINIERVGLYDYVFIDEAQDFGLPFFDLCRTSLTAEGKLIYAYDELQTLSYNASMPTPNEIFKGECYKDVNLKICYRTPNKILISAHALGMGIYSNNVGNELCNIPIDLSIWSAIGYINKNSEPLEYGKEVSLYRNPTKTDNFCPENPVDFIPCIDQKEEYQMAVDSIYKLVMKEDVLPSDILIIDLDIPNLDDNFYAFKTIGINILNRRKFQYDRPFSFKLVNKYNRYSFKSNDAISYTSIFRAKGNESNIVFILNADKLSSLGSYSRNQLFTAMTRAKYKVFIYGTKMISKYIEEYDRVVENDFKLNFKYPTKKELEKIKIIAKKDEDRASKIRSAADLGKDLKKNNSDAFIDLMLAQAGVSNVEDLIAYLNEKSKANH